MVGVPRSKGCVACLQRRVKVCNPTPGVVKNDNLIDRVVR